MEDFVTSVSGLRHETLVKTTSLLACIISSSSVCRDAEAGLLEKLPVKALYSCITTRSLLISVHLLLSSESTLAPSFSSLSAVVTDWSDAEINGLGMAVGKETADKLLKLCKVHVHS